MKSLSGNGKILSLTEVSHSNYGPPKRTPDDVLMNKFGSFRYDSTTGEWIKNAHIDSDGGKGTLKNISIRRHRAWSVRTILSFKINL